MLSKGYILAWGVYSGLGQFNPGCIFWPRPDYTRVYSGQGFNLACYTGSQKLTRKDRKI